MIAGSQAFFIENVPNSLTMSFEHSNINEVITHFLQEVIENESELSDGFLQNISLLTYNYLLNNDNDSHCKFVLISEKWIWMDNLSTFIAPSQVAIRNYSSFRTNLEPYIFVLPSNLQKYSNVFVKYGHVCEQVTPRQIISVLHSIKNESAENSTLTHEEAWSIIKAILDWIAEDETRLNEVNVLVPVESSSDDWPQLFPLSEVTYTDNEMLREMATSSDEEYHLIHPKISYLSSQLKLTPLSDHLDITEDVFDDAGQHEPLTTRLSNILKEYKDGLTIIKEMIQNADDAEATEVNILYDNTQHSTDNLLFKEMANSHGKALIVHNNSTFTDEDFENITKLASATKANQLLKIGKFGVGFCSVYHITDVPSFVSGEWLYIFDPTLKHLKGIVRNESRPGKKIKYQSKYIARSKQLVPYEGLFNFSSSCTYNGTMFRFPFRTCASQISSTIYDEQMITQMKNDVQLNGSQLLLFLQNVKKITFSTRNNNEIVTHLTIQCTHMNNIRCITRLSSTEYWLVSSYNANIASDTNKLATASVACHLVPNDSNSFQCLQSKGAVFCFLPLAVPSTGLPVHVSANFAVMSNRSGIWTGSTGVDSKSDARDLEQWNQQLMETVIPKAYCNLLIKLKEMVVSREIETYDFHSLWPIEDNLEMKHLWNKLVRPLYHLISKECLFYSHSTNQWLALDKSQFLPSSLFHGLISANAFDEATVKLKLSVVSLPSQTLEQLEQCCYVSIITEHQFARWLLSKINLLKDSIVTRNTVLYGIFSTVGINIAKSAMTTDTPALFELLKKYPCVPCSPNGVAVKLAKDLVDPLKLEEMFDPEDGKFPIDSFNSNDLIHSVIVSLGLMSTDIPWDIILASAKTVEVLFLKDKNKANKRVKKIVSSIDEKSIINLPDELKTTQFLPALQKPKDYILPWKGDDYQVVCPCQVIASAERDTRKLEVLVGSQIAIVDTYKEGCGYIPKKVLKALGISHRPLFNDVLNHLRSLINVFQPSMCGNFDTCNRIEEICRCVYEYFENYIIEGENIDYIKDLSDFKDRPFIWTGQEFAKPSNIAKTWKRDSHPYLYKVPDMLSERKNLLKCLKIKNSFNLDKLVSTLSQMHLDFQAQQIPEKYHTLIDDIILELHSVKLPDDLTSTFNGLILPDDKYCFHSPINLTYNDAVWLPVLEDVQLVHPKITRDMAKKFGVSFTSSKFLDKFTSQEQNFQGVPFGQKEELTQRIKNILHDYPLDVTFLKELLQNADDAKATKMCIILDKRQHRTEKLLSESWEELQGPAVLVWNDKEFTDKDLEGIQKLGLGSKRDDYESIGQFGIGFNVVYHLTDCPSLITRQNSVPCVFDPHCRYVPGASPQSPGRQYNSSKKFWSSMPDLKSAYLQENSPNQPNGLDEGVLFRFPLHCTKEQIMKSELVNEKVKTEPLTAEIMEWHFEKWVDDIKKSLLFLNHIIQFEYYIIDDSNKFQCKRSFKVHLTDDAHQDRESLKGSLAIFKKIKKPKLITYQLSIESSIPYHEKQNWFIQQGVGDIQDSSKNWTFLNQILPKHGIAAALEDRENFSGQVFCFLPLPVYTDLPVHINGQFALSSNRRSLWNSSTDEPDDRAKWNESLIKAIASSYVHFLQKAKEVLLSSDGYKEKNDLYNAINTYYSLFPFWNHPFTFKIKMESHKEKNEASNQPTSNTYETLGQPFPSASPYVQTLFKVKKNWMNICTLVFDLLWSTNAEVLSSERKLIKSDSFKSNVSWDVKWHVLHNDDDLFNQAYFAHIFSVNSKDLKKVLRKLGMTLTCAPVALYKHFEDKKPAILSRESVYEFYTKFHHKILVQPCPCPIVNTPFETVEDFCIFLKYLLGLGEMREDRFSAPPGNTPLLLTADCQLRSFHSLLVFRSKYSQLFENSLNHFLHPVVMLSCQYISSSYFASVTQVTAEIINRIMLGNYSHQLQGSNEVDNSKTDFISIDSLKNLWTCLNDDPYFKQYQEFIAKNWALIPSQSGILYCASSPILPLLKTENQDFKNLFEVLVSLGFPVFKEVCTAEKYCINLSETEPSKVLLGLYHLHLKSQVLCNLVNPQEIVKHLFNYFGRITFYHDKKCLQLIKSLPLFKNANNEYTTIKNKSIFIWPNRFCNAGFNKWAHSDNTVFLERDGAWNSLVGNISIIGGQDLSDKKIYSEIVFSSFGKLTPQERKEHLKYIKDNIFFELEYEIRSRDYERRHLATQFLEKLKKLECLEAKDGCLQTVSFFSDHTTVIFKTFSNHFSFVPDEYQDANEWLEFLNGLGLRKTVTIDEFITFCNQVSEGEHAKINFASNVLVSYLFSDSAKAWHSNANYLSQIGNICFAVVDQLNELRWIKKPCQSPSYNQAQRVGLTRFNEAVIYDSAALIWTVKPVISQLSIPTNYHQIFKYLGLTLRPNVDDVLNNLRNISQTRLKNFDLFNKYDPTCSQNEGSSLFKLDIETVVTQSLNYLFECKAIQHLHFLCTIPCIPVSAKKDLNEDKITQPVLVKPVQIVRSTPNDCSHLFPYVHTLPPFMNKISHNLEDIGIYQTVNIKTLQHMLQMMHEQLGDSALDPNNIVRVTEAILKIDSFCKDQKHTLELIEELFPLYYPNNDGCLCISTELVFNDLKRYKNSELDFSHTTYSLFQLPSLPSCITITSHGFTSKNICLNLPKKVRPKSLSFICKEEIFAHTVSDKPSPLLAHFQKLKKIAPCLMEIMPEILKAHFIGMMKEDVIRQFTSTLVETFITSAEVIVVKNLKCYIKLLVSGESVGIAKVPFMFQLEEMSSCILYVDPDANIASYTTCKQLVHYLCLEVARMHKVELTTYFKYIDPVCESIRVQNNDDLQQLLEKYQINSLSIEESSIMDDNTVFPGKEIPEGMRGLLDYDVNHMFYPEEWVGYEASSRHFVYVIVLHSIVEQTTDNIFTKKYRIMIGENEEDRMDVSGLDLYKFISEKNIYYDEEQSQDLIPVDSEGPTAQVKMMIDSIDVIELKRAIYKALLLIWQLPDENERRKAEKRLYLSYHPDKNPDHAAKYEEAFKYLKRQIENHDEGLSIENPDHNEGEKSYTESVPNSSRRRQYRQWDVYTHWKTPYTSRSSRNTTGYEDNVREDYTGSNTDWQQFFISLQPQRSPEEAMRWLKQAKSDLQAMKCVLESGLPCQVLFLAHEASEKALKAGMYQLRGLNSRSLKTHELSSHAYAIASQKGGQWSILPALVSTMEQYYLDSRYPNRHVSPIVPVELYTLDDAQKMANNAEKVLKLVDLIFVN